MGVLVFGIAIGSATTWVLVKKTAPEHQVAPAFKLKNKPYIEVVLEHLERKLHLNSEQTEAVREEMQQMATEFRALHDQTGRDMKEIIEKGQNRIKSHLNPDQVHDYEEHIANLHFRMKQHMREDHSPEKRRHGRSDHDDDDDFRLPPPPPPPPPGE